MKGIQRIGVFWDSRVDFLVWLLGRGGLSFGVSERLDLQSDASPLTSWAAQSLPIQIRLLAEAQDVTRQLRSGARKASEADLDAAFGKARQFVQKAAAEAGLSRDVRDALAEYDSGPQMQRDAGVSSRMESLRDEILAMSREFGHALYVFVVWAPDAAPATLAIPPQAIVAACGTSDRRLRSDFSPALRFLGERQDQQ